jgi:hypothetical protein
MSTAKRPISGHDEGARTLAVVVLDDQGPMATVVIQAYPIWHQLTRFVHAGEEISIIARLFETGDSGKDGRCHLCPLCTHDGVGCTVVVNRRVPSEDAPLFSLKDEIEREKERLRQKADREME